VDRHSGKVHEGSGVTFDAAKAVAPEPNRSQNHRTPAATPGTISMGSSRVTGDDQRRTQFISLMNRYCQLGRLLPAVDDVDTNDVAAIADARLILR